MFLGFYFLISAYYFGGEFYDEEDIRIPGEGRKTLFVGWVVRKLEFEIGLFTIFEYCDCCFFDKSNHFG